MSSDDQARALILRLQKKWGDYSVGGSDAQSYKRGFPVIEYFPEQEPFKGWDVIMTFYLEDLWIASLNALETFLWDVSNLYEVVPSHNVFLEHYDLSGKVVLHFVTDHRHIPRPIHKKRGGATTSNGFAFLDDEGVLRGRGFMQDPSRIQFRMRMRKKS